MKNKREIDEKINYWMDKLETVFDSEEKQWMFGIIDALLWVIDDESGKKI